jgi:hypothetical protein
MNSGKVFVSRGSLWTMQESAARGDAEDETATGRGRSSELMEKGRMRRCFRPVPGKKLER